MPYVLESAGLMLGCALLAVSPGLRDDDGVEKILIELKSTWALPVFDRSQSDDASYTRAYEERLRAALNHRVDLIGRFYRMAPEHPDVHEFMWKRWADMMHRLLADRQAELIAEVGQLAADEGNPLRVDASFLKARLALPTASEGGADAVMEPIEAFIALAPEDDRGAELLFMAANLSTTPAERKAVIFDRILTDYPDSGAVRTIQGSRRLAESIGKPFQLTFRDVTSGRMISLQDDLRGKVVVIDFWATWCGPCVAELPRMRELYARYKEQGVEFVGISLDAPDEGGHESLMTSLREHQVGWPQFHGEASIEFARHWGVNAIPSVFVVDSLGNLYSTDGRGKLDSIILELLR